MRVRFMIRAACIGALMACLTSVSAGTIGLAWDASSGATGYRVYWGPSSGNYTNSQDVGNNTTTLLTNVANCTDTFFAVTAYNSAGESGYSNEIANWPRPEVASASPGSAQQGSLFSMDINGNNFKPGAVVEIDNANVFLDSASVQACNRIQVATTVEPTAANMRPAEIGQYRITVTNDDDLADEAQVFQVLINPERFDIVSDAGPSQNRIDGRDSIYLGRLFGSREGQALYDPDLDFDGDGWIDGSDLTYLASNMGRCWNGSQWTTGACP